MKIFSGKYNCWNKIELPRKTHFFITETKILLLIPIRNPSQADFFISFHESSPVFSFPYNPREKILKLLKELENKVKKTI